MAVRKRGFLGDFWGHPSRPWVWWNEIRGCWMACPASRRYQTFRTWRAAMRYALGE